MSCVRKNTVEISMPRADDYTDRNGCMVSFTDVPGMKIDRFGGSPDSDKPARRKRSSDRHHFVKSKPMKDEVLKHVTLGIENVHSPAESVWQAMMRSAR